MKFCVECGKPLNGTKCVCGYDAETGKVDEAVRNAYVEEEKKNSAAPADTYIPGIPIMDMTGRIINNDNIQPKYPCIQPDVEQELLEKMKASFTVNFGTPSPVSFTEQDDSIPGMDLELEARIAGRAQVYEYDKALYPDEEAVRKRIRDDAPTLLCECFKAWPKGKSAVRGDNLAELSAAFERELIKTGISAFVQIVNFSLTEESKEMYQAIISRANELRIFPFGEDMLHIPYDGPIPPAFRPDSEDGGSGITTPPNGTPIPMGITDSAELEKQPSTPRFCTNCGAERHSAAAFCPQCGAKLN